LGVGVSASTRSTTSSGDWLAASTTTLSNVDEIATFSISWDAVVDKSEMEENGVSISQG
jgi:hypothetical protein